MKILLLFLLLTACQTTQRAMITCDELDQSYMNNSHDNFLIESCLMKVDAYCADTDGNCINNHAMICMEEYFNLKATQTRDYRAQQCWLFHVEPG